MSGMCCKSRGVEALCTLSMDTVLLDDKQCRLDRAANDVALQIAFLEDNMAVLHAFSKGLMHLLYQVLKA